MILKGSSVMIMRKSWKIYWRDHVKNTYLYGSKIRFIAYNDIYFENDLMPPGTIIKEWFSKVNFQMMRIEPSLPLIDGESNYHIKVDMTNFEGFIVRFVFYDRFDNEAGTLILNDMEQDFKCPLKTYSYRLQIINAGGKNFHFHSFEMIEKEEVL